MRTELTLEKKANSFGFEVIESNEMNNIVGGADVCVDIDPVTGRVTVFLRPSR